MSAGYGLIGDSEQIAPYDVTFSGKSKRWIRERGARLALRSRLAEISHGFQNIIIVLGRDYMEALGLPVPTMGTTRVFAYIAPSLISRVGPNVETKAVGPVERQALGAYSSSAKEYCFLLDVRREVLGGHR
jgi:hypothetical protein